MFDARLRPLIDPLLNTVGQKLAEARVTANQATLAGLAIGVAAGGLISQRCYAAGLCLLLISRLLDGLDGAIARATAKTDFGGYLDIVCDFAFYTAIPVGFGTAVAANTLAALVLVASFTLTGISFLAYAVLAEKHGQHTVAHGEKSFFYNTGIAEGTETILAFTLMCLWPQHFCPIAYTYTLLCLLTVMQRSWLARRHFDSPTLTR